MKSNKTLRLLSLAGLGTLLATSAFAQDHSYYYGGVGIGQSRVNIDNDSIKNSQLPTGLSTTGITREDRDMAYKLFGGYQFNQNFALEAGYFNLGKFGFASTTFPAGTLDGQFKVQGVNFDLVGTLPMTERFSLLGRVGVQHAKTSDTFRGTGAAIGVNSSPSKRDTNYKVGAGMQYEISPAFLVRGEVERYRINDAVGSHTGVNMLSVSLVFPFGREEAPRKVALAPVYVAPEPEVVPPPVVVAPAPVVVAAPVVPRRVTFSADSLFTFDQAAVGSDGKVALDKVAKELEGTQFDTVVVEGHTDRLGSQAYNQKLSLERAEAVKSYLVTSGHVDAAKISATGKGESAPVTKPEDCQRVKPRAKLIACLQADRRVEVEVTGTR